jgi:tetratricopeptide (TPR) repeat protein
LAFFLHSVLVSANPNTARKVLSLTSFGEPQVLIQAGATYFQQGQWTKAIEVFEQAAAQQPLPAVTYIQWRTALTQLKRHADAIGLFAQAVALNPQNAVAYQHWGFALGKLGCY